MKIGAVPYWPCGGEVLTRALDANGRLVARQVTADEARRLIGFYGNGPEFHAITRALTAARAWSRAARNPAS